MRDVLNIERLEISSGERVAIIGPNGAGKTTLLRLLGGSVAPSCGQLQVLDRKLRADRSARWPRVQLLAHRLQVGQVLQGVHLLGRLSAIENVLVGSLGRQRGWSAWLSCFGVYPPHEKEMALRAMAHMGVAHLVATRSDQLSGGERQKVAIARLVLQAPRLILADEPTSALDPAGALEVCKLLARAAVGATLVTVVHNPALLPMLADRVIGLKGGRMVFDVPTAGITEAVLFDLYGRNGAA